MSENKINIELDKRFVEDIFKTAGMPMPETVTQKEFQTAFAMIKNSESLSNITSSAAPPPKPHEKTGSDSEPSPEKSAGPSPLGPPPPPKLIIKPLRSKSVLIVDDLGIIVYQLSFLFKKCGFEVTTSQEINDAIEKYKAKDFGYAVLDLFIPTEREGFYLIDEIKKLSLFCQLNTKIIVMSAISKEIYTTKALNHGAHTFIEKSMGWQKNIIDACSD